MAEQEKCPECGAEITVLCGYVPHTTEQCFFNQLTQAKARNAELEAKNDGLEQSDRLYQSAVSSLHTRIAELEAELQREKTGGLADGD